MTFEEWLKILRRVTKKIEPINLNGTDHYCMDNIGLSYTPVDYWEERLWQASRSAAIGEIVKSIAMMPKHELEDATFIVESFNTKGRWTKHKYENGAWTLLAFGPNPFSWTEKRGD